MGRVIAHVKTEIVAKATAQKATGFRDLRFSGPSGSVNSVTCIFGCMQLDDTITRLQITSYLIRKRECEFECECKGSVGVDVVQVPIAPFQMDLQRSVIRQCLPIGIRERPPYPFETLLDALSFLWCAENCHQFEMMLCEKHSTDLFSRKVFCRLSIWEL